MLASDQVEDCNAYEIMKKIPHHHICVKTGLKYSYAPRVPLSDIFEQTRDLGTCTFIESFKI
jgi:hypothetical protein